MQDINTKILILFFLTHFSYSQSCGGGEFKFEFYTKNKCNLKYEIFEVEVNEPKLINGDIYNGEVINKNMLDNIKVFGFNKDKLPKIISQSMPNNEVINNELVFNTLELFNKIYLLKVWNQNNEVYILVNLFGGCNRMTRVIISENPMIIK